MEGEKEVRLYGVWASAFSKRVELALKLKGIPYEYVEEDLSKKSEDLLKYNPVYKKIPVLVHNGKPICDSLVILEYIDEIWHNHSPRLLPSDPYQRAMVRFWVGFLQNQLLETGIKVAKSTGEAQDKAVEELHEKWSIIEQNMTDFIPKDVTSMDQKKLGLLDIVLVTAFGVYKAQEEALGKKIIDPEKHARVISWINALNKLPAVIENAPSHEKLLPYISRASQHQPA